MAEDAATNGKDVVIAVLEFIGGLVWPCFAAFLLWFFLEPVTTAVDSVPELMGRANVIEIGDLKVELEKEIGQVPSGPVRAALADMNGEDIATVLERADSTLNTCDYPGLEAETARLLRLGELGVLSVTENPEELARIQDLHEDVTGCWTVVLTPLGEEVYDFLIAFISTSL